MVSLSLSGRCALVAGAGPVAARKVSGLLEAGARVTVVAPAACEAVRALAQGGRIILLERAYRSGDLDGAFLAVAATDDEAANARLSEDARARGILVNVVDRPSLCTFTLPAVVRRGDLSLSVATEGRCPALARALREELEARYGEAYGPLLECMGRLRDAMMERGWESPRIQAALSALYAKGLLRHLPPADPEALRRFLEAELGEAFPISH